MMAVVGDYTAQIEEYVIDSRPATTMALDDYICPLHSPPWGDGSEIVEPDNAWFAEQNTRSDYGNTLVADAVESGHVWTREGLQRIAELGALGADWHDCEAAPPNPRAVSLATDVFLQLSKVDFMPSSIDASTGEGICIHFSAGNRTANIECFNSGEIFAATMRRGGEPSIWEVTDNAIFDGVARIYEFISG